jgi:hypothetical protein
MMAFELRLSTRENKPRILEISARIWEVEDCKKLLRHALHVARDRRVL